MELMFVSMILLLMGVIDVGFIVLYGLGYDHRNLP